MTVEHIVITIIFFFLSICEIFTCPEYIGLTTTTNVIWNSFIRNALASSYDIEGGDSGADHADRIAKHRKLYGSKSYGMKLDTMSLKPHKSEFQESMKRLFRSGNKKRITISEKSFFREDFA